MTVPSSYLDEIRLAGHDRRQGPYHCLHGWIFLCYELQQRPVRKPAKSHDQPESANGDQKKKSALGMDEQRRWSAPGRGDRMKQSTQRVLQCCWKKREAERVSMRKRRPTWKPP